MLKIIKNNECNGFKIKKWFTYIVFQLMIISFLINIVFTYHKGWSNIDL